MIHVNNASKQVAFWTKQLKLHLIQSIKKTTTNTLNETKDETAWRWFKISFCLIFRLVYVNNSLKK